MTFKEYILHHLRETKREVMTALDGLGEADMLSFEPAGHWPIAWIAEHLTATADAFLIKPINGERLLEYHEHVARWPKRNPQPGDPFHKPAEIVSRWEQVCDWITAHVEAVSEADLQESPGNEPYIHSILRIVNHTNAHLRNIWCIIGQRRLDHRWPEQQSFLA